MCPLPFSLEKKPESSRGISFLPTPKHNEMVNNVKLVYETLDKLTK